MKRLMIMRLVEYPWVLVCRIDLQYFLVNIQFLDGYSIKIENGSFRWSNLADDSLVLKKLVDDKYFLDTMTNLVSFDL
jgi:hypothetical protein